MAKLTPEEYQEKHARRLKASTDDIARGVERVTEAPGKKAAAKKDKMRTRMLAALDSGKWEKRVAAVPLSEWQSKMVNKGIGRIASGIDDAADKVKDFAGQFLPFLDTVKAKVDRMPDVTLEDSIARMTTQVREVSKFERK